MQNGLKFSLLLGVLALGACTSSPPANVVDPYATQLPNSVGMVAPACQGFHPTHGQEYNKVNGLYDVHVTIGQVVNGVEYFYAESHLPVDMNVTKNVLMEFAPSNEVVACGGLGIKAVVVNDGKGDVIQFDIDFTPMPSIGQPPIDSYLVRGAVTPEHPDKSMVFYASKGREFVAHVQITDGPEIIDRRNREQMKEDDRAISNGFATQLPDENAGKTLQDIVNETKR